MEYLAATDSEADVIASGLFLSSFAAVEITTAAAVAANLFLLWGCCFLRQPLFLLSRPYLVLISD